MVLVVGLFVLSICSSVVDAKPLSPRQAVRRYVYTPAQRDILEGQTLEKRQFFNASSQIVTTGPSGGVGADGSLPVRNEVRELAREERAWSLYLLAMERMMMADQSDPLSWYQIAGMFVSFSPGYTSDDIADQDRHSWTSI
jgi:hypothetical protein